MIIFLACDQRAAIKPNEIVYTVTVNNQQSSIIDIQYKALIRTDIKRSF